jgi:Protein of unknown function (DUF4232)
MTRPNATIAALLAALALAACGGTTITDRSPAPAGTGTSTSSTARSSATGSQPKTTTTSTAVTTTSANAKNGPTAASTPACVASMLKLAYLGGQGATGHGELGFSLTNTSQGACHTYGYPGVQFQSSSGSALPTQMTRTTQDFFGSVPLQRLVVAPDTSVSFRLVVSHGEASSAGCESAARLQVIPPDDTHTLLITVPNGGAYECGTGTVSPLQPGDSAYSSG